MHEVALRTEAISLELLFHELRKEKLNDRVTVADHGKYYLK